MHNIAYLMGCIPVSKEILDQMNNIVIAFVNGNERMLAENRKYNERYGIIDMNILVLCIKANRVRRWITQEKVYDYSDARVLKYEKEAEFIKKGGLLNVEFIMCGEILDKWME